LEYNHLKNEQTDNNGPQPVGDPQRTHQSKF